MLIFDDVRNVEMYEGNPGLASQVIGRFFSNILSLPLKRCHYTANVVFIGVNENAIAFFIESMLIGPLAIES